MNLQDEHIDLCIYLWWAQMNRLWIIFHVQRHSDNGGHYKQHNMLGLGKKLNDFSILDSHFYEPISIIKSE